MELSNLTPDPDNAKGHPDRNIDAIRKSIETVGPARSIVIDENGVILAGNATVAAATAAGVQDVRVIESDGKRLIAVRVSGLTPEQKKYLALADNRTGELGHWKPDEVRALFEAGLPLVTFWTGHELTALLRLDVPTMTDDGESDGMSDVGGESFTSIAGIAWGKTRLRLTPDQAARLTAVLALWGDDLTALGEAIGRA